MEKLDAVVTDQRLLTRSTSIFSHPANAVSRRDICSAPLPRCATAGLRLRGVFVYDRAAWRLVGRGYPSVATLRRAFCAATAPTRAHLLDQAPTTRCI